MAITASVGQASSYQGRDAGTEAVHAALSRVEGSSISLALVFASSGYEIQDVLNGVMTQIGDTPVLGFSTSSEITREGNAHRSVVVALLGGDGLNARAEWQAGYSDDSLNAILKLADALELSKQDSGALLVVADGLNGDADALCNGLPLGSYQFAGCLAGGELHQTRTYQIGGNQSGSGGLAGAFLSGSQFRLGVGVAHGWQQVGANFKITNAKGPWIRALNGKPASESYASLFGHQASEWSFPPLNTLIRLYPLGIEQEESDGLKVRTPLRVEADGSLRMNSQLQDGAIGHLLVGGTESCLEAARQAALQALSDLEGAVPKLALIFADISWEMLLKSQPGSEIDAVRQVLGEEVPIAGGYTFGQLAQTNGSPEPEFLNQHIEVVLIGEKPE